MRLLVAVLVCVMVAVATASMAGGLRAGRANEEVHGRLLPALAAVEELQKAYRDQLTAQREYVLSGQRSFLLAYEAAPGVIDAAQANCRELVVNQASALAMLDRVGQAYDQWLQQASRPLALVADGRSAAAMALIVPGGLYDQLYTVIGDRVDDLRATVREAITTASARAAQAQRDVLRLVAVALGFGLLVAVLTLVDLRRSVIRPITDLITSVSAVVGGRRDRPVRVRGPAEITRIASAVERMRQLLAKHTRRAVAAEHQASKSQESERIAGDLRLQVIEPMSGTGISLTSLASRHPELAEPLMAAVQELDEGTNRMRRVIFDLSAPTDAGKRSVRQQVFDLVGEVEHDLGFVPSVSIGDLVDDTVDADLALELLAAIREALSAMSLGQHPDNGTLRLDVIDSALHLFINDDSHPQAANPDQRWTAMTTRATRLGGSCAVRHDERGNTVLDWMVPIENPDTITPPDQPVVAA